MSALAGFERLAIQSDALVRKIGSPPGAGEYFISTRVRRSEERHERQIGETVLEFIPPFALEMR